ncbi:hypothetical protein EVAR_12191_1 [Eumeta japonica]|uniref:Uncharacterized protein n=1 Tax=Eumeta variegata TaxID=151549 RepID=A0A4C1UIB3_EUMVA|nr:hypothetical protein EVAR_12191_1 [Eumeta japonica]
MIKKKCACCGAEHATEVYAHATEVKLFQWCTVTPLLKHPLPLSFYFRLRIISTPRRPTTSACGRRHQSDEQGRSRAVGLTCPRRHGASG